MSNLLLSFNVVLPLFIQIFCGYAMGRKNWIDDLTNKRINSLVFKFFLPLLLFKNIYTADLKELMDFKMLIYVIIALIVYSVLLCLIVPHLEKENARRGVIIQASMRSNVALFGLPLGASILGAENAGPCSLVIAAVVPCVNILSVIVLELFRGGKLHLKPVLFSIIKNPLVIACSIAVLFQLMHFRIPAILMSTVGTLSGVATPLSLIALGAAIRFEDIRDYIPQLSMGLLGKLIIDPIIFVTIAALLGFRGAEFVALMIVFSAPTAVSSYTMADQMGGDGKLASQLVFYSTALSIPTLFLIIFTTKSLGLF